MRRKWRKAKPKEPEKKIRANQQIRASEVFLINEEGERIGNVGREEALSMAREAGMDLAIVNPKSDPPVAKIVDLGQLKYEQEKKKHKQKMQQKKVDVKGIRLSVRISEHDFNFRLDQAIKFLSKGNKLKIELILKGREKQHPEKAREAILKFVEKIQEKEELNIEIEQALTKQGGRFSMILINRQ